MSYRATDRFENWFITSLQTGVNDTTSSFRLNDNLNVNQCRLVIDPYDESVREVVKVTSVDGNLVYVERGDDNTAPQYHLEGAVVALDMVASDMNDLYADWFDTKADLQQQQDAFQNSVNQQISDVEALAFLAAHPVGSTYWNETVSTNPGSIYGGTWVALKGVVLGGISDVSGSPFNVAAGTIIGADTHTLTTAQIPSHRHGYKLNLNHDDGQVVTAEYVNASLAYGSAKRRYVDSTEYVGGDGAHNNIQCTLVGYMWKRTA